MVACATTDESWMDGAPRTIGPTVVVAEGDQEGTAWRFFAFATDDGFCSVVEFQERPTGPGDRLCEIARDPPRRLELSYSRLTGRPDVVTGLLRSEADRLTIDTRFDGSFAVDAIEPPAELNLASDLFVAVLPHGTTIVRVDVFNEAGDVIQEYDSGLSP